MKSVSFNVLSISRCGNVSIIGVTKTFNFTLLLTKFPLVYQSGLHPAQFCSVENNVIMSFYCI